MKRRIVGSASGAVTPEELQEARGMLEQAIKRRQNWSEPYIVSGQLYLVLEKDPEKALAAFDEALKHGATNLNAIALQVRLLAERGRLTEARQRMERIPSNVWSAVLDRAAADVLIRVGDAEKALVEAEKVAKRRSQDAATQAWYT